MSATQNDRLLAYLLAIAATPRTATESAYPIRETAVGLAST